MGLFDSAAEKERKRLLKEEEKERKRKEFERIMASNPEVSSKPQSTYDRNKLQSSYTKKDDVVRCPKCGSTSITANKKGFSLAKGAAGVLTFGAYGVLTAGIGKNKIIITCLKCGKQFKPGR